VQIAHDDRKRLLVLVVDFVPVQLEMAVAGGEIGRRRDAMDELLVAAAVTNELRDAREGHFVLSERSGGAALIRAILAVVVEDLDEHAHGRQAGEAREVHRSLRVPRATEHATFLRDDGLHVAGPREVLGASPCVDHGLDRGGALRGRDPGPVGARVDGDRVARPQERRVVRDGGLEAQLAGPLGQQRHAKLPAAVRHHEIHELGGDFLGGADEIALVFAVLVVDDDGDAALRDPLQGLFDRVELHGELCLDFG
jgi:hypothetical protein